MTDNIKVVIADDIEPNLLYLEKTISEAGGFEVVGKAKNGKDLIEVVTTSKPDLVITDVEMPECDGIQAIKELNQLGLKTEYILITGNGNCLITSKAKDMRILKIIRKPILDDKKFIKEIKQVLIQSKECEEQKEENA